jgi:ABC-type transporter Mla maintaining outer membrane lipid asymmetry permease subunit MlaE
MSNGRADLAKPLRGINPLQSLVVPRVLAGGVVAILLSAIVSPATLVGPASRRQGSSL